MSLTLPRTRTEREKKRGEIERLLLDNYDLQAVSSMANLSLPTVRAIWGVLKGQGRIPRETVPGEIPGMPIRAELATVRPTIPAVPTEASPQTQHPYSIPVPAPRRSATQAYDLIESRMGPEPLSPEAREALDGWCRRNLAWGETHSDAILKLTRGLETTVRCGRCGKETSELVCPKCGHVGRMDPDDEGRTRKPTRSSPWLKFPLCRICRKHRAAKRCPVCRIPRCTFCKPNHDYKHRDRLAREAAAVEVQKA